MIDWFASKLGLFIFIMLTAAVLLLFVSSQIDIYSYSLKSNAANDVARLIDSVKEGSYVVYDVNLKEYTLAINSNNLEVNDVSRSFISNADPKQINNADKLNITREDGIVKVKEVSG